MDWARIFKVDLVFSTRFICLLALVLDVDAQILKEQGGWDSIIRLQQFVQLGITEREDVFPWQNRSFEAPREYVFGFPFSQQLCLLMEVINTPFKLTEFNNEA